MKFDFLPEDYTVRITGMSIFRTNSVEGRVVRVTLLNKGVEMEHCDVNLSRYLPDVWPSIMQDTVKSLYDAQVVLREQDTAMANLIGNFDKNGRVRAR